MALERHGLKVVLRKTDNFLPGDGDYLLSGRGGLTRKEIARHVKADAEGYDRYIAELESVVGLLKKWLLRAPPNAGSARRDLPKLLSLGRDIAGLSTREIRTVHDFATRSAAEILDRHFEGDLTKALFGFDGVVGNFASPRAPGTAYVLLHHLFGEAAGVPGAWGHAIGGMGSITQAMARACREAGVDILLNTPVEEVIVEGGRAAGVVAGGKAWRSKHVISGVNDADRIHVPAEHQRAPGRAGFEDADHIGPPGRDVLNVDVQPDAPHVRGNRRGDLRFARGAWHERRIDGIDGDEIAEKVDGGIHVSRQSLVFGRQSQSSVTVVSPSRQSQSPLSVGSRGQLLVRGDCRL